MPPYTLKSSPRAKHIRISIRSGGIITVTKPKRIPEYVAVRFAESKIDWIKAKLQEVGESPRVIHTPKEIEQLKIQALRIAEEKVRHFNTFYHFPYKTIRIKNQKTRWGSCSRTGNLNFNYKLALLPEYLADYLIVHELCHLGQFNHSQKFWDLVGITIPDYKIVRAELHKIGL